MSTGLPPDEALAAIPGWRGAAFRELPGGLTNRTLLVEKGDRRAVLKIDPSPRRRPFNSRREEARIQQRAAALGRANGVLYAGDTVLLAEWADGEVWTRAHFDDDANLVRLGRALREIHGLPLTGRTFDLQAAARQYAAQLDGPELDDAKPHLAVIESAPGPVNLCCCHNDLVAENMIETEGQGLLLIDWEYTGTGDPMFDLAVVIRHHDLDAGLAQMFLEAYLQRPATPEDSEHLSRQCRFYGHLLQLWNLRITESSWERL